MTYRTQLFLAFLSTFCVGVLFGWLGITLVSDKNTLSRGTGDEIFVDVSIVYDDEHTQHFTDVVLVHTSTPYDALFALERRHGITIDTRRFGENELFIEAIHGVRNTSDRYWSLDVNNTPKELLDPNYILTDGDHVIWERKISL